VRDPVGAVLQLAEGTAALPTHHRDPLGHQVDGVLEQVRDVVGHSEKLERVLTLGKRRWRWLGRSPLVGKDSVR